MTHRGFDGTDSVISEEYGGRGERFVKSPRISCVGVEYLD